jgi:ABC-2 type transport system ATP-binding protein
MPEAAIDVSNLCKRYGAFTAVNNLTFSVAKGEILGFLGPNGAGKSTTMRILTGFLPASSGEVRVAGFSVGTHPEEVKRRIGYMPENNPLPEDLRVREYLRLRGSLKGLSSAKLRARIEEVTERCDLKRVSTKLIGSLSKGFRQRVGIAEAILAEPEIVIMDEPTIGLDPHQIVMIRDLISSLRGKLTMLISSHILPEIEATCDRVLIINSGHIVASGTAEELRRSVIDEQVWIADISGPGEEIDSAVGAIADLTCEDPLRNRDVSQTFREVRFISKGGADLGETLLRALVSRPALRIRSLAPRKASLEDVFLSATRRSWETLLPERGKSSSSKR